MLTVNPHKRITATEALKHPWISVRIIWNCDVILFEFHLVVCSRVCSNVNVSHQPFIVRKLLIVWRSSTLGGNWRVPSSPQCWRPETFQVKYIFDTFHSTFLTFNLTSISSNRQKCHRQSQRIVWRKGQGIFRLIKQHRRGWQSSTEATRNHQSYRAVDWNCQPRGFYWIHVSLYQSIKLKEYSHRKLYHSFI